MTLRGVAGDERAAYVALAGGDKTVIEAYRGGQRAWQVELPIDGGSIAAGGGAVYVSGGARGAVRGDPGALVVALDTATGATKWQLPLESTRWAHIASLAVGDGVIAGGSFAGSLRVHDRVVASAGDSDGFVARVDGSGQLAWLVRMGGTYADAVQGVAVRDGTVAVAGTFTSGADFLGQALPPFDPASPMSDAFVASLDAGGARKWAATFGGKATDAVAGVALDDRAHVVVAANARDIVHVGSSQLEAQGAADGLLAWLQADGEKGPAILVGGLDFDGINAIAAADDGRVLVGGFFSGAMRLGPRTLSAGGGDDSFIALFDASSDVEASWQVGGEGREEVVGLAAIPGGFVAGVAHTASAKIDGGPALPAPADPLTGAALIVRGLP
jgi:outer membrane protein assembly factor BamB